MIGSIAKKGILITLVVLGHWLEATNYWDDGLIRYLLTAIYAFHMPAFIFLAGITSKPDKPDACQFAVVSTGRFCMAIW